MALDMNSSNQFLKTYDKRGASPEVRVEVDLKRVRCSACRYASPVRCVPEIIDCSMLGCTKNAELSRQCGAFVAK